MQISKRDRNALKRIGSEAGKLAASRMTPEQRSERARKAVAARWAKAKEAKGK